MASARWYQAPAVDVRRGWESEWQDVADDLWDTVARIREAAPFPQPPQTEASADGGSVVQSPMPRPEGGGLNADGSPPSTAPVSPTAAFLEQALNDAATPLVPERRSVPRAKARQPLRERARGSSVMQKRLWALVNDQRCATVDGDTVRAYEFAVEKLRGEFRQLVTASFAVLYDLGYEPPTDALDATVDAASGGGFDAPLGSDGSQDDFTLPRTASVEDDDVPTAERDEALEWVLGVLVTLRRHCAALLAALKGPLRPLQGPMLAGPCAAQLLAEEVRRAFLHKGFFKALARAVASLEHPSRFTQPDTSSQNAIAVPPSGLASSNAAILKAMVQLAQWAMQCGVREMVSCFADELKVRWAHAASQLVEGMSPELGPVATAAQLLGVIEHCDSLLRLLSAAIGGAHVSAVRAEVVQAVLCRDTVGLVVRTLFAAATKATIGGTDGSRLQTSAGDFGPEDFDVDASLVGLGEHQLHQSAGRGSGGVTDESSAIHAKGDRLTPETEFGSFGARATPDHGLPRANAGPLATPGGADAMSSPATLMLMRVLVHGAGTDHVRDELALAVADVLYDSLGGARIPSGAAATAGSPTGATSASRIDDRTITPVLHLLDAVALVRKVLHLGDVCIKKASLRTAARLRVTPASAQSAGSAAVAACCAEAVGEALVQVVGAHSALFERVLADMLFGGVTGLGLDDLGDDLLALCERTRAADRFIENCKHVVASRFLRAPEVDPDQPGFAPATLPHVTTTSPAANPAPPQRPQHAAGRATPHLRAPQPGGTPSCGVSNAAGGGVSIAPSPATFLLHPVGTVGASSLPTGSIAASEAGRGVTHAVEVHAALREWMPPEVIAPLTSLITEVNVAFFVNSDTVASPMNASAADLHDLADDFSPTKGVVPAAARGSTEESKLELSNAALEPPTPHDAGAPSTPPERPRYVAQCRCLASALWRPHLLQCAHVKADATVVNSVLALNQLPALASEMSGCMRWLESQYARAFPKRRLSWPALTGDVKLWFRLPHRAAAGDGDLGTSASHGDWLTTPTKLPPRRSSVASGEWHLSDPGTAAMGGGRQLRGGAVNYTEQQQSNRTGVTVIATTPAVGHALLLFNARPEMTLTDLKAAMLPLAPSVVERLAAYIVASGIIVSRTTAADDDDDGETYLQVADSAPRSRRVALLFASWAVAAGGGDFDGAASEASEEVGPSAASTADAAAMEAQLQSSRQRTVEAAMVRLLKRERACTIPELFAEVTASLRDRFPVEQRMLRTAVGVVVDREFAKRDDSVNPPLLVYVA